MKKVLVFRHAPHEGLGTVESFLKKTAIKIEYCDLFVNQLVPVCPKGYDFVISMGGPMNVDETERYPFLKLERLFIADAVHLGVPTLGICLGAQLIACALGAPVYRGHQKEIGWYPIHLSSSADHDPVLGGVFSSNPLVFHWHEDTFDLPDGAIHLASSDLFPNQAFRFREHVYAFQFHLEVTPEMISDWLEKGESELRTFSDSAPGMKERIEHQTQRFEPSLREFAERLYGKLFSTLVTADATF